MNEICAWSIAGMILRDDKSVTTLRCASQLPNGPDWDRTCASVVTGGK